MSFLPDLDYSVRILLYSLIFLLSVFGNALIIIVLILNKRLRTVTNSFLLSLALSDLMVALFCMPFTLIPNLIGDFIFGEAMCKTVAYFMDCSVLGYPYKHNYREKDRQGMGEVSSQAQTSMLWEDTRTTCRCKIDFTGTVNVKSSPGALPLDCTGAWGHKNPLRVCGKVVCSAPVYRCKIDFTGTVNVKSSPGALPLDCTGAWGHTNPLRGAPSRVLLVFGVRFRDRPSRSAPCISPPSVSPPSPVCAPVPVAAW
ncbi:UNVERIFIED_CONTAM: hypothetical protein FKN15_068693 [Acipenser sinensis]